MKILLFCLLLIPVFTLADVSPPAIEHHIPPPTNGYQSNNHSYNGNSQNPVITVNKSPQKSHFNSSSSSGGSVVGGRGITTTVNNGYGNTGTIATQAASSYSKAGAIRAAANKSVGVAGAAYAVWGLSQWSGEQVWNLYDCVVYDSCHPNNVPQIPSGVPTPPQSAWEAPQGAYDPNATYATVFYDASGQPMIVLYNVSLGSGGGVYKSGDVNMHNGINVYAFGYSRPSDQWGYNMTVDYKTTRSSADLKKYENLAYDKLRPEDFQRPLTADDLYNALIWNLENMPQEIATAIMNALHDGGFLGAPESTTFDPASYTSPPYTAADTGIAQQDKFTQNQNGSITHQVVPRPDLQGNQQLAPEKQPSTSTNPTTPTDPTNPTDPTKPTEKPEIDWDMPIVPDTVIPTQEIPIFFAPENSFNENGVCPQPATFTVFGSNYSVSYEPMCELALKVRPVVILCGIFLSMLMVFSALAGGKES